MMRKHVRGHKSQRPVWLAAAAAAASMVLAVSGGVATADTGTDGSGGTGSPNNTPTAGVTNPTGKVTSPVKQRLRDIRRSTGQSGAATKPTRVTSGSQSTIVHNTSAPTVSAAVAEPGLNIGNPPPGMPGNTGNTNYGNQTNPVSVQFYNLGSSNNNVANNVGPDNTVGGPGVNLVNLVYGNTNGGNNAVRTNNFGINIVSMGSGNDGGDSVFLGNGDNLVNVAPQYSDLTGSFGGNLAVVGDNNQGTTGHNHVEGANSIGLNIVSAGNGNEDAANNGAAGNNAFGANFAAVGSDAFGSGYNVVRNNGGAGTTAFGANYVVVGDSTNFGPAFLGVGGNQVEGINVFGTNWAVVLSTAAHPTLDAGTNTVQNDGAFGNNFAVVGGGSSHVGNNTSAATGGGLNLVWAMGNNTNVGNNTGGGINVAVELPGATNVGNCTSGLCINLFGMQLVG
jgi:hypothetical protein